MKRRYTWQTFEMDFKEIKELIYNNYKLDFDAVYAPTRGGLILGTKLSHELSIPLGVIDLQTRDSNEKDTKDIFKLDPLNLTSIEKVFKTKVYNILLVDEIADSGKTLKIIEEQFKLLNMVGKKINIIVVTIYGKKEFNDEYGWNYIREMQENDWIYFPWEKQNEDDCFHCDHSEPCNKYGKKFIHCKVKNKSFLNTYSCVKDFKKIE